MSENKKPRLAEVLGVEVGEKFEFVGGGFNRWYYVDSEGWLRDRNGDIDNTVIAFLFKCPQYIRRKPRWTEQDKEDAKALKRLIPNASHVWRHNTSSSLRLYDEYGNYILTLNDCFATLPLQESATLDEIIGDEDNDS